MNGFGKWLAGPSMLPPETPIEWLGLLVLRLIAGLICGGAALLAGWVFLMGFEWALLIFGAGFIGGILYGWELVDWIRRDLDRMG